MKRSIKSLTCFTMGATDGEIGKVKGFYFDDHTYIRRSTDSFKFSQRQDTGEVRNF